MINFDQVKIDRLKDKSSPSNSNWLDQFRTWCLLSKKNITSGKNIIIKPGVQIRICETGTLAIGDHSFFHSNVSIFLTMPKPSVQVGKWVFVGMNTVIACKNYIRIGDYTVFAPNCYVIDHEHGFRADNVILNQRSTLKSVEIGRDCYFGTGSVVCGGVIIGDGAIVGANSVVTQNIPAFQIWAGNPAKFIRNRE